jgi:hypothetical protein
VPETLDTGSSIEKQTKTHGKLNGLTFPHIMEITSFNSKTFRKKTFKNII